MAIILDSHSLSPSRPLEGGGLERESGGVDAITNKKVYKKILLLLCYNTMSWHRKVEKLHGYLLCILLYCIGDDGDDNVDSAAVALISL